ncbi:MAG: hypothetical protein IPM94_06110 [bacterium]|nr:hypothetical protein [bacterium]
MTTTEVRGCLEAALPGTRRLLHGAGVLLSAWGLTERPREWMLWLECRDREPPAAAGARRPDAPVWRAAASWPRSPRTGRRHALAALAQVLAEVALVSGRGASPWRQGGLELSRPEPARPRRARAPSGRCG